MDGLVGNIHRLGSHPVFDWCLRQWGTDVASALLKRLVPVELISEA